MYDFGYIAALFFPKDVIYFKELVKRICEPHDLYMPKGDVTHKLHLTFFYGIREDKLDKYQMDKHIENIKLKTVELGNLILIPGTQDFQVLSLKVADNKGLLEQIYKSFRVFTFEQNIQNLAFTPHIALAYVKPTFKLVDGQGISIPKKLKIKEIKYFGTEG